MNPGSVDNLVGGQTAQAFADIFLRNYDQIKAGRRAGAATGGGSAGMAGITPGVGGTIMQEFGPTDYAQAHPSTYAYGNAYGLAGSQHPGVDWAVPLGTKVATPLGGTVSVVGNDHGTGYYYTNTMSGSDPNRSGEFAITLDNGDILILGHMSRINVNVGDRLGAGALIGLSGGSDGAHVHVEYRQRQADGSYRIVDPRTMLGGGPTGGGGNLTP
jgi:murein DD-endopeptidase MepM/ murein hydrolase activator NlpD